MKNIKESKRLNSHLHFENKRGILLKCKRSQITIFIIVAIIIVAVIALFFFVNKKAQDVPSIRTNPEGNIRARIELCAREAAINAEKDIIKNGGLLSPNESYFNFNGSKIAYICYTPFDRQLCTNKHPMLSVEIENEIKEIILPKVEKCFSDIQKDFKKYNYKQGSLNITVEINPDKLSLKVNRGISFEKDGNKVALNNFNSIFSSPLYDFTSITNQIINQELTCECGKTSCNADLAKLTRENRKFSITKPLYNSNGVEIYSITEILTEEQFNIALRNCALL